MNDYPRPLFKVLNHRQERFRFNLFLSNVIYIEIGCNKVNTKNENIFNFIDAETVSNLFQKAGIQLCHHKDHKVYLFKIG